MKEALVGLMIFIVFFVAMMMTVVIFKDSDNPQKQMCYMNMNRA